LHPVGTEFVARRPRLATLAVLGVALMSLLAAGPASAAKRKPMPKNAPVVAGSGYLALGDSETFGYVESSVVPAPNYADQSSFVGYPELLASELHLKVANAACPGETSTTMINPSAQSNGCENSPGNPHLGYRLAYPLHVHYQGSQLAFALSYLRAHANVRLVTLMIGANDGLICIETTPDGCTSPAELGAVLTQLRTNITQILTTIRRKAHYRGQIVIVNYDSPLISFNPRVVLLNAAIDAVAKPFGVLVADGYGEFQTADADSGGSPCVAGLLTQLSTGGCGIHPSYAGQSLLAQAVEKVIRL
jgi:lysophospholipase L1-like esterase